MSSVVNFGIGITLADHFTNRLRGAESGVSSFTTKLAALSTVSAGIGSAMLGSFGGFTEKFAEVAQKQGDIKSLGIDTKGMEAITSKAIAFSNKWSGVVAKDFIGASYDIKSGIESLSNEGVSEMTRYALLTAKATKASSATMSKVFAMGHGIFRDEFDSDFDFGEKFSATIAAAVQGFRTDGADLAGGLATLGADSKALGVSLAESMAVLGMSKGSFDTASTGATSYRAFLTGATKAQDKLGLSFVDGQGKLLPMADILDKLGKKYKGLYSGKASTLKKVKEAFGSDEAIKIINALIGKTDKLREAENNLKKAQKQGIDYTKKMAQAREYGQEYSKLSNQFENFSYIIGKQLAPAMGWLSSRFGAFINKIVTFVGKHEKMAQTIATGAVAFATTAAVLGTVGVAVAGVSFGLSTLGLSFGGIVALSAPFVAVLGAIGLAGYSLYQNWDKVSVSFSKFTEGIREGIGDLQPFIIRIKVAFAPMAALFSKLAGKIKDFFNFTPSDNISNWGNLAGKALGGLVEVATVSLEGLTRLFNYTVEGWSNIFSWVPDNTLSDSLGVLGGIWQTAMDGWGQIIDFGMSFIRGEIAFDPAAILSGIWGGLDSVFSTATSGWGKIISLGWDSLIDIVGWNPMDTIKPLWDKVTSFLSDALADITGVFNEIGNIGSDIGSSIGSAWDSASDFSVNIGSDIGSSIGSAWDSASDFAVNFMGGDTSVENTTVAMPSYVVPTVATQIVNPNTSVKKIPDMQTIAPDNNTTTTTVNEGANSYTFNIKGDNPNEIAQKVKAMLEAQSRDKRQRSIE